MHFGYFVFMHLMHCLTWLQWLQYKYQEKDNLTTRVKISSTSSPFFELHLKTSFLFVLFHMILKLSQNVSVYQPVRSLFEAWKRVKQESCHWQAPHLQAPDVQFFQQKHLVQPEESSEDINDDHILVCHLVSYHQSYPEVFECLSMGPEEGKGVEMNISFNSQMFKFPEEGQLAKVKSCVSSESLVSQEDPQAVEIGAMPSKVDKLGPGALLVVELKSQPLQSRTHHSYERSDVIKPHGDQVELHEVLQAKQGRPHSTVRVVENRNLVVNNKVELPQLGKSICHQLQ